tara:strand:- start:308 stop:565 length:258 start_codon:yes stop_codon:yes gene_type:complete
MAMRERDYKREYARDHASAGQRAERSSRNKARRKVKKSAGAAAIAGKDIDHKDHNPLNNSRSNLSIASVKANRSDNGKRKRYRKA